MTQNAFVDKDSKIEIIFAGKKGIPPKVKSKWHNWKKKIKKMPQLTPNYRKGKPKKKKKKQKIEKEKKKVI